MKIHHAGADISAQWFDLCLINESQIHRRRFQNSRTGLGECVKWLESFGVEIDRLQLALEPTGRYGELVAEYFHLKQSTVLSVQPLMFSRYCQSLDMRDKSDSKDAIALAHYCRERGTKIRQWRPLDEIELELRDAQLLIRSLTKRMTAIQCQLKCGLKSQFVKESLMSELAQSEERKEAAIKYCTKLIKQHPKLSDDFARVMTIPGIGEQTAALLLSLIDFRQFATSRALACFLGLTKKRKQSGTSVKGPEGISKRGNTYIRAALFMPARVARRHNEDLKEFSERLAARGKHDWAIQAAVIRKLVTTAWALVANGTEFDTAHTQRERMTYAKSPI